MTIAAAVCEIFARQIGEPAKYISALWLVGQQSGAPLACLIDRGELGQNGCHQVGCYWSGR